jgi:hypothetical protein
MKKATLNKRVELKLQRLKKLIKMKLDLQTLKRLKAECGPEEEIEAIKKRIREGILREAKEFKDESQKSSDEPPSSKKVISISEAARRRQRKKNFKMEDGDNA